MTEEESDLIAGSTLNFQSALTNLMSNALTITTTDPSASPRTCRKTPRMFNWALDSKTKAEKQWRNRDVSFEYYFATNEAKQCEKITIFLFSRAKLRG